MNSPSFIRNLIAFSIGVVLVAMNGISLAIFVESLIGGYISLSIYHSFRFAAYKFGDLFSIILVWLLPIIAVFLIFFSLVYGFTVSIPKFIISAYRWKKGRSYKEAKEKKQTIKFSKQKTRKSVFL